MRCKCCAMDGGIEIPKKGCVTLRFLKCCEVLRVLQMDEKGLEKKVKKKIEEAGGLCLKWVSPGFTGVPDRIGLLPGGRVVFIEVKSPTGKGRLSGRQNKVIRQLRSLGFRVLVIDKEEQLEQI